MDDYIWVWNFTSIQIRIIVIYLNYYISYIWIPNSSLTPGVNCVFEASHLFTAVMLHWEGRMKTGPKWPVNSMLLAAKIYYYRIFYTSTFFSNGRISETKQDFLNALVPKFSYRRGLSSPLSWKWPRPTLSSSFGLFLERKHFFGVFQVGQSGPLWSKTCPRDPFVSPKKNLVAASHIKRLPP